MIKEVIYFSDDNVLDMIADILLKNGIEETLSDVADQEDDEISLILTVFDLTKNLAIAKISEKEFIQKLQVALNVSQDISRNITAEINKKILPSTQKIELNGGDQQALDKDKSNTAPPLKREITSSQTTVKNQTQDKPISSASDKYREPIG